MLTQLTPGKWSSHFESVIFNVPIYAQDGLAKVSQDHVDFPE